MSVPSIEERREVAERLRAMCAHGCRYAEQFYELLNETVMDEWDFHGFQDVAERLADLIEPLPELTCRNTYKERGVTGFPIIGPFTCSSCGEHTETMCSIGYGDRMIEVPKFCPHCGARVAEP